MELMKTIKSKKSGASTEDIFKREDTLAQTTALGEIFISPVLTDLIPELSKMWPTGWRQVQWNPLVDSNKMS